MENQLTQLPSEVAQIAQNVSFEKRNEVQAVLNHVFNGVAKMREQLDGVHVENENDKVNMKLANTIRLGVRQVRLDAEKTFDAKRAEVQQQMLSFQTEDKLWLKAKQTMQILTKEIEENARWKEETRIRFDVEQNEIKVQQRILQVSKFAPEIQRIEFEHMSDVMFNLFLAGIEKQYNERIEAEKKAEKERIAREKAEAEERERIRKENERLKYEAEAKEKAMQVEREKVEAERKALEEKARKEREENERKLAAEREKARIEAERIEAKRQAELKAEREKQAKLQAELEAKRQAELKAENERKAAEASAKKEAEMMAKAPIKNQLFAWVSSFSIPETQVNNELSNEIKTKFESFKKWATLQIEQL